MADRDSFAAWWQKERERDFTKLECGLMGALFACIAIIAMIVIRFHVW